MPVASTQAASALMRFLSKNLDLKRTGGTLFVRDSSTLILSDMYNLSHENLKNLESRFPQVTISIVSSSSSRSGFLVVIDCGQEKDNAWQRSMLRLWMHFSLFLSTWLWAFQVQKSSMPPVL